jgi:hypothetical protein
VTVGQLPPWLPLTPISRSANYTAADGDYVICASSLTLTLPDTPRVGAMVGIECAGVTVTVNRGGFNSIRVPVQASATSITITGYRTLTLIFDGSTWVPIGAFPLQWTALPFATGWQNLESPAGTSYPVPGYSIDASGIVRIRGPITKTSTITLGSVMFTLPAGYRAVKQQWFPCEAEFGTGNRAAFLVTTDSSGAFAIFDYAGNAPSGGGFPGTYVFLDSISYEALA